MRQLSKLLIGLSIGVVAFVALSGCESEEKLALAKAEQCLNKSEGAASQVCLEHLEGYYSEKAYMFRCAIAYKSNGFDAERLAEAFKKVKNADANQDPMITVMSLMAFEDSASAAAAAEVCERSNVVSFKRFATMTVMATSIAELGGFLGTIPEGGLTPTNMETAINDLAMNLGTKSDAELEVLADAIVDASEQYCAVGSAYENTPVCENIDQAMAEGTPRTQIQELLDQLLAESGP